MLVADKVVIHLFNVNASPILFLPVFVLVLEFLLLIMRTRRRTRRKSKIRV